MPPELRIALTTEQPPRASTASAVELTRVSEELLVIRIPTETRLAEDTTGLTDSERAVVALAMAGKSNAAIAAERRSSPRTIANQLASAYQKLGLSGRRELRAGLRGRKPR